MSRCDYCNHVEMCGWRKDVEEQGCEFFDDCYKWIPCSEKMPEDIKAVNITWVNHNPVSYYEHVKDMPFVGTAHYGNGKWWWESPTCEDYLAEYGESPFDEIDKDIEVIAWMPLPEPWKGASNDNSIMDHSDM